MPPWLSTLWLCVCCLWGSGESRAQGQGGEGAQGIRGHGERWLSHALHLPPLPPTHTHTHTHTLNQAHTHTRTHALVYIEIGTIYIQANRCANQHSQLKHIQIQLVTCDSVLWFYLRFNSFIIYCRLLNVQFGAINPLVTDSHQNN